LKGWEPETQLLYVGFSVLIITLAIALAVLYKRISRKKIKDYYRGFAIKHGFVFNKEDVSNLKDELKNTSFVSDQNIALDSITNCLTQENGRDRFCSFNCYSILGHNQKMHYTTVYFKLSSDLLVNLRLGQRDESLWIGIDPLKFYLPPSIFNL